ncbi:enoyl-CoA hydratase/isomerase family protein [Flavihumibacter sp. R14]|nr:enoyl-CoA hydratase/isomerase family protein [Flavihumibacter soli]
MTLVNYTVRNRVAYITLNRPGKRNALNPDLVNELSNAFALASADHLVKVIVLNANGEVFSAGADLAYLQQLQNNSYAENVADSSALRDLFYAIYTSPKVVIAQVEGHAIAGGCGLVSVCDIIYSVPEAKYGYTEVKIGFIPALVACFLVRKLGEARTKELLLTGDLISAEMAVNYGLINFMCDKALIQEKVREHAEKITAETSSESIALTKQLLNIAQNLSLEESLVEAVNLNAAARATDDCKRGIAAFLNKEKITW